MATLELLATQAAAQLRVLSLRSLALNYFRNYAAARIEITPAPVVITGRNGMGKTNILEAISLLTPGRGLRRAKISDLDNRAAGGLPWSVAAGLEGMQGDVKIGTGRDSETTDDGSDKRLVRIDGKPLRGQSELARHCAVLWLTPQMEQLFLESASAGRKFLDRLVFSFDSEHASRVNEYEYAMRERNRLLQTNRADSYWLDALEQTMAETASAIAQARLSTAEHINHAIERSPLSFPKAHVSVAGTIEEMLASGMAAVAVEEDFKSRLKASRGTDTQSGRTQLGTHRSEMNVIHVIKQMPAQFCSTGEQKALLLSIVLAQARASAQWHGVVPILLLDEVVAHLDATRRLELFEEICQIGAQTWMTGTDASLFAGIEGKAQYYQVDAGSIIPTQR